MKKNVLGCFRPAASHRATQVRLLAPLAVTAALLAACGGGGTAAPSTQAKVAPATSAAASASTVPAASPSVAASAVVSAAPSVAPSVAPAASPSVAPKPFVHTVGVPVELMIPSIKVDAQVEQVGEDAAGAMDVPKEWNDVGWFNLGYRPGEAGNSVIDGHLDSTTDRAVFWDLHLLKPGDKVLVKDDDSKQLTFQVMSSTTYPYDQAPLQQIFGPASGPQLNLITCNGTFDRATANYNQRLVVYTKEVAA
ncbi:MAG TPA: class F sortase [Chloroflexota bacterium]|nr:class F sortase [Chloroflexota bacterium]